MVGDHLRIKRAHSYATIEAIRAELASVPKQWRLLTTAYQWIVYPDDLSPVWTGLIYEDMTTPDDDRLYSDIGGWCALERHAWFCADTPHIFIKSSSTRSVVHEVGHALAELWHAPVKHFFKPQLAFYDYMALNPAEYFACAFEAYLRHDQDDEYWNRHDLAKRDPDLFQYFEIRRA